MSETLELYQYVMGVSSGLLVGFSLGLFGGGGSILAVPLLVSTVGAGNAHHVIGTSAVAVAANSLAGVVGHARRGTIKWRCAAVFGTAGMFGAALGSAIGKAVNGRDLLLLFAGLMFVVAANMFRHRHRDGEAGATCTLTNMPKVLSFGAGTGLCSGFFGIGGGFLIVPGLMTSTGMPMINAISTSLVIITVMGLTTAISYALSGLVLWSLALAFVLGGSAGVAGGAAAAHLLSRYTGKLKVLFALMLLASSVWLGVQSASL